MSARRDAELSKRWTAGTPKQCADLPLTPKIWANAGVSVRVCKSSLLSFSERWVSPRLLAIQNLIALLTAQLQVRAIPLHQATRLPASIVRHCLRVVRSTHRRNGEQSE